MAVFDYCYCNECGTRLFYDGDKAARIYMIDYETTDFLICSKCYGKLQQAHRAGWEQAKREAYGLSRQHSLLSSTKSGEIEINELAIAIAVLEYKEPTND